MCLVQLFYFNISFLPHYLQGIYNGTSLLTAGKSYELLVWIWDISWHAYKKNRQKLKLPWYINKSFLAKKFAGVWPGLSQVRKKESWFLLCGFLITILVWVLGGWMAHYLQHTANTYGIHFCIVYDGIFKCKSNV